MRLDETLTRVSLRRERACCVLIDHRSGYPFATSSFAAAGRETSMAHSQISHEKSWVAYLDFYEWCRSVFSINLKKCIDTFK